MVVCWSGFPTEANRNCRASCLHSQACVALPSLPSCTASVNDAGPLRMARTEHVEPGGDEFGHCLGGTLRIPASVGAGVGPMSYAFGDYREFQVSQGQVEGPL